MMAVMSPPPPQCSEWSKKIRLEKIAKNVIITTTNSQQKHMTEVFIVAAVIL